MNVVLLSGDLMAISRLQGAASQIAAKLLTATNAEQAIAFCSDESVESVVIDLTTPGLEIGPLLQSLRHGEIAAPKVVAFAPHVHEERLAAAQAAGCDEVVSRGQFFTQIEAILGRQAK
jgi:DNA-binding NarL/FixJ family response regulator